ncbi:unnamed protein product [Closterium sp. Naga37s-1]|nr:unnamed protein product [Closterium sp. Naga37s-1]
MDVLLLDLNDASRASSISLSNSRLPSRDLRTGDVCQVKVVGAFAVVQQKSRLSWKLLAIPAVANAGRSGSSAGGEDDVADQISDVADVHSMFPGLLDDIREWLRFCDCIDPDDEENEFGLNQRAGAADVALAIIAQAHASWQLLTDDSPPPSPWSPANVVLSARILQEKWRKYTDQYYMETACKGDGKGGRWEGERGERQFSVGSLGSWQGGGGSGYVSGSGSLSGGVAAAAPPLNLPFVPFSDPTTSRAGRRFDRAWEETSRAGSFAVSSARSFSAAAAGDADGSGGAGGGVGSGLRFGGSYRESRISSYGGSSEGPSMVGVKLRSCKSGPMVVRFGALKQEEGDEGEEGSKWRKGEEGNQEQKQEEVEEGHGNRSYRSVECGGMQSRAARSSPGVSESAGGGGTAAAAFAAAAAGGGGMKARRKSGSWDFGNMTVGGVWIPDALAASNSVTTGNILTPFNTIGGIGFATDAFADICAPNENDSATVAEGTGGNRVTLTGNKTPATEHSRGFPLFRHSSLNRGLLNDHKTALAKIGALWGGGGLDRPPPEAGMQVRESAKLGGEVQETSKPDGASRAVQRRWGGWRYGPLGGRMAESPCVGGGGIGGRRRRGRQGNSNWPSLSSSSFGDASIADTLDLASPRTSLSDAWDQVLISSLDDDASLLPLPPSLTAAAHPLDDTVAAAAAAVVAGRGGEAAAETEQDGERGIGSDRLQMETLDNRSGDSNGMLQGGSSSGLGARPVSAVSTASVASVASSVVTATACQGMEPWLPSTQREAAWHKGLDSPEAEMRGMGEDGSGVEVIPSGISLPTTPSLPSSLPSPTSTVSSATISIPRTYSSSGYGLSPPNLRGQVRSEVLQLPAWVDEKAGARGNGGEVGMGRVRGSEEAQGAEGTESEGEERREKAWERKREEEREREWERERERFVVGNVSFREGERKEGDSEGKEVIDKEGGGVTATGGCLGGSEAREERSRKMRRQVSFNSVVKVYEYDDVR